MNELKAKPFALIGVNVNERESKNLKERMAQEKMNWRSFAYQDSVNETWNPSTPGYYVLDAKGVIRHKNLRDKALEDAVVRLLAEKS